MNYFWQSIILTERSFVLSTYCATFNPRILFVGFLVKIWLLKAAPRLMRFLAALKRFAAPRTVFIFGMLTPCVIVLKKLILALAVFSVFQS
jgi:hypothetical protein